MGDEYWPAKIITVGYMVSESDGDQDDGLVAGDIVPYQARRLGGHHSLFFVPRDDNHICCALDADNLIICPVVENVWDLFLWPLIRKRPDEANRLLRIAVSHRLLHPAKWIARRSKIPVNLIGPELLSLAVKSCEIKNEENDSEEERFCMRRYDELFDWLKDECGAPLHDYRDGHGHHVEHIAAINGDVTFLCWLLLKYPLYCRGMGQLKARNAVFEETQRKQLLSLPRDFKERTPLHYAATNEKVFPRIVETYMRGKESFGYLGESWFKCVEDLDAVDLEGKTALEYTVGGSGPTDDMVASLEALRQQTCRGALKEMVEKRSHTSGHLDDTDYAAMWKFAENHGLDLRHALAESERYSGGNYRNEDNAAVLMAIESSNLPRLQFALKVQGLDVASVRTREGLDLMHVAAGRSVAMKQSTERYVNEECSDFSCFPGWWDGGSDLLVAMKEQKIDTTQPEERCTGHHVRHEDEEPKYPSVEHRQSVVRWLISTGKLPLPECEFIVRECDLPAQKLLLESR
jgi:hypothetical protein